MSTPVLFTPFRIGNLNLCNRIVVAPMCQYSAVDGRMNDWHLMHLGSMAISGAALVTVEATAVLPEGRITYGDVGLWDDATESAMRRTMEAVRRWSNVPFGIQISHAGRKASTEVPWQGGAQLPPGDPHGWQTEAPSTVPFLPSEVAPRAMNRDDLKRVRDAFAAAAVRAARLGFDALQLHGAHGYLIHQFLSPLSNRRDDEYGGSLENRMRFPLEIFDAVRAVFPPDKPITLRISGTDWVKGGWDIEQTVAFAEKMAQRGCAAIHVSSGGLASDQQIPAGPSYQVPLGRAVKNAVKIPVITVGLITGFEQAEAIVATGDADLIALARAMLWDPRWPWHAAAALGAQVRAPDQYLRSAPPTLKGFFIRK